MGKLTIFEFENQRTIPVFDPDDYEYQQKLAENAEGFSFERDE